ncbi:MAG: hypothetical protein M3Q53_02560 [Actinomycetota bacterium]|nr:hypothetical protein [Actinomycetota bacterium]
MAPSRGINTTGTRILAPLIGALGLLIIIRTLAAGGGLLSIGVLLGLVFLAIGAGRLYLSLRAPS